jgi:hypothetical protein
VATFPAPPTHRRISTRDFEVISCQTIITFAFGSLSEMVASVVGDVMSQVIAGGGSLLPPPVPTLNFLPRIRKLIFLSLAPYVVVVPRPCYTVPLLTGQGGELLQRGMAQCLRMGWSPITLGD